MYLRQFEVNLRALVGLEKRINSLERQILDKNMEIQEERDRCHAANQLLFKAGLVN
jgi:predicted  nucleic acid-binding Zn-ribbon protein